MQPLKGGIAVRASIRNKNGQSALELTLLLAMVAVALLAMSQYVRFGIGGRLKSSGEGISQALFNPEKVKTAWSSNQTLRDRAYVNGYSHSETVADAVTNRKDEF